MKKISNSHFVLDTTAKPTWKTSFRHMIKAVKSLGYKARMTAISTKSHEKKYKVSICAIFKNEALYLKEWIEFNHIIGIDHFYLYNNNSEDDYQSVLKPYIDSGLVTLIQWPQNQAQMECYNECITQFRNESQWIGFIDIDEFIVPIDYNSIYDFLKPFEKNRGALKIYWKMFGTSGLLERDLDTLVSESFVVSWPKYYSVGKCFYNTNFEFDYNDSNNSTFHHMFWAKHKGKRIPPVNAFNNVCLNEYDIVPDGAHPIQINHYFTKSYQEYAMKKAKGDVYFKINPHDEEYFYLHEMENTSFDYSIFKYLIKLKLAMKDKK